MHGYTLQRSSTCVVDNDAMHAHAMHICQVLHLVGHDAGECPRRHHRVSNVGVLDSSDASDADGEQ